MENNKISVFVMSIIGIAVVLVVGLIVIGEMKTSTYETDTITNEEQTLLNATNVTLAVTAGVDGSGVSLVSIINQSGTVPSTEYIFYSAGIIELAKPEYNGTAVNVTYSFTNHSDASYSLEKNATNLATIPTWIGILITVALAFIVLTYFYKRR